MSIPDPTIDPITGLPLLNPNTPIQQIPLGADVFPFADLKASAQPARGPIYGDDIFPTSSLLSGQHPTLGNAQTVQTDGSHAAKVYVVNPSGGGVSPVGMGLDTIIYLPGVVSVSKQVFGGWYPLVTMYAMTWGIYYDLSTSPTFPITGYVGVGWENESDTVELPTHTFFVAAHTADATAALSQTWTYTFPIPMDLNVTFNHLRPSTKIYPYCNNSSTATVIPWVQVYLSPL